MTRQLEDFEIGISSHITGHEAIAPGETGLVETIINLWTRLLVMGIQLNAPNLPVPRINIQCLFY